MQSREMYGKSFKIFVCILKSLGIPVQPIVQSGMDYQLKSEPGNDRPKPLNAV